MPDSDYTNKGRLTTNAVQIERYRATLDKDNFQPNEPHWRRISKNTISLFQVLIDQDLSDLVMVLEHYPRYTEWACEHFRYAYRYSENSADIAAASRLLFLGEPYFSKQFVRNVVRKLPAMETMDIDGAKRFVERMLNEHAQWHPIVTNHYCDAVNRYAEAQMPHPLQRITLTGKLGGIERQKSFDYEASDRDAVLDIPYMN